MDLTFPKGPLHSKLLVVAVVLLFGSFAASLAHIRLDSDIMLWANYFSRKSYILDHAANDCTRTALAGAILMSMVWFAWFRIGETAVERRAGLVVGVLASGCAGACSRIMQVLLPTHTRPLQDASLHFLPPFSVGTELLHSWSSFPSDHASLYVGLATTIFLAHRRTGYTAFLITCVLLLSRIYLGLHFPTDIVGGTGLGMLFVTGTYGFRKSSKIQAAFTNPAYIPVFYATAFYVCYSACTLFADLRDILAGISHGASHFR